LQVDLTFSLFVLVFSERKAFLNAEHGFPQAACLGVTGAAATPIWRQSLLFGLSLDA
jgi:hypothetical protein